MSCNIDFINYIVDQLNDVGVVSYRKMFGEYMIYVNQKPVILVCDDIPYVRKWECIASLCEGFETGFPYDGAKEHYILDVDDREALVEIIREVEKVAKVPVKKTKKTK